MDCDVQLVRVLNEQPLALLHLGFLKIFTFELDCIDSRNSGVD